MTNGVATELGDFREVEAKGDQELDRLLAELGQDVHELGIRETISRAGGEKERGEEEGEKQTEKMK